ncbi:MAG: M14 family zinc carboxypeptidase [Phaeodactylibacter sp.]|uniref:M14 family zinc carboxypeptidase n=1 Tax=Phaeodactylibacter sp. TaxID=1940289 RepID=UPI0032EC685B
MSSRFLLFWAALVLPVVLNAQLLSPSEFLPYQHGAQFTPHHVVVDYMEHVAAQSPRVQLEQYGTTNEGRPLLLLTISDPANLSRIEDIRKNNLRRARQIEGAPDASLDKAIVWLSFGVHGNEAGATESSMSVLYELAREDNPETRTWLEGTIILLDPALNPDGYARYTEWYRRVAPVINTPEPATLEHQEPWPGGRVNHYHFDLNRDWAWQTQVESQQRMSRYQQWMPHIHVDYHEQYPDNPYYFAPAAAPYHEHITDWQSDFQYEIGQNHAKHFDQNGWLYFTREVFDLLYPSYGDTYPTFNGSVGMTYEQAGHGISGRGILMENGDTLTLKDRIAHHTKTALSTVEVAYRSSAALLEKFGAYFDQALRDPMGEYRSYVISKDNPVGKLKALARLLDHNNIQYGTATENRKLSAFDYQSGKKASVSVEKGDLIVSAYQPQSTLVQVLFEPAPKLEDSLTYDITAWALPYAYGLKALASSEKINADTGYEFPVAKPVTEERAYAYVSAWTSIADARFLAALQRQGIKVRYATASFGIQGEDYTGGTLVITQADNRKMPDFDDQVRLVAKEYGQQIRALRTGFSDEGFDLGSDNLNFLKPLKVALFAGSSVSESNYGEVWHFFEQVLEHPLSLLPADNLASTDLNEYNVIVLAEGRYTIDEPTNQALQRWMREGGRLIALGSANQVLVGQPGFSLSKKEAEKSVEAVTTPEPYGGSSRRAISNYIPGAIFPVKVDTTHPLGFGLGSTYYSLKTSGAAFNLLDQGWSIGYLESPLTPIGFAGSQAVKQLENTLVFGIENKGRGAAIYLIDNPLFRGFWEEGKLLFCNALFLAGQ